LSLALRLLIGAAIALIVGLGTVRIALDGEFLAGTDEIGPWTIEASGRDATPYSAALRAIRGRIPLGNGEGIELRAIVDSAGARLDPDCVYLVRGRLPTARLWTFTVADHTDRLPASPPGRFAATSDDILWRADGSFEIVVAPRARAGNWIPSGGLASLALTVRLYDAPSIAGLGAPDLPAITRQSCPGDET